MSKCIIFYVSAIYLITNFLQINAVFFFALCFSAIKNNKLKSAIYSLIRIFNHNLHYFLLAVIPANFTFCSCF